MNYIEELIQNRAKEVHYDDTLCHHGIKGQKWGIRRFQYEDGSLTPEGRERYGYGKANGQKSINIKNGGDPIDWAAVDRDIVIPFALATTAVSFIVSNVVKLIKYKKNVAPNDAKVDKKLEAIKEKRKNEKKDRKTGLYLKNRDDEEDDEKVLNPYFQDSDNGGKLNCQSCSLAYELRRRGYDVYAKKTEPGFMQDLAKSFKDPIVKSSCSRIMKVNEKTKPTVKERQLLSSRMTMTSRSYREFYRGLLDGGEGSRGNVSLQFLFGGGHSMAYEVKNGKVYLKDAQSGSTYRLDSFIRKNQVSQFYSYMRTDNLEINVDEVKKRVF